MKRLSPGLVAAQIFLLVGLPACGSDSTLDSTTPTTTTVETDPSKEFGDIDGLIVQGAPIQFRLTAIDPRTGAMSELYFDRPTPLLGGSTWASAKLSPSAPTVLALAL
jgi:hypothetical protein